ncbi:DUF2855 family protein [Sphingomicrobium marinum]|uniref:DUF2855 family protein n=1 Tax=Sphingomicrobium marinum TaxID=1227950 RepID=UPI00223F457F|nr:DUF2855 family protein [Sphingomicrobium marinum]
MGKVSQFEVCRNALGDHHVAQVSEGALADGDIRVVIERFAFTANNMTYGVAGDMLGYWKFFPVERRGWGMIPVWAIARIVESRCNLLNTGERLYGYFPPAQRCDLTPGKISDSGFSDMAEHRQDLPPLYNRYTRLGKGEHSKGALNARVLLAPLHITSFCLHEALKEADYKGAEQVLIASASSKTSLGLAFGLKRDEDAPPVIGLTSRHNVDFVRKTKLYDQVVDYDSLEDLDVMPSVLVDMAGSRTLVADLYRIFGDALRYRYNVGITHWQDGMRKPAKKDGEQAAGDAEMFFAPSYVLGLVKKWGAAEFDKRSRDYVSAAGIATFSWMDVDEREGLAKLNKAYPAFVDGSWPPDKGLVILP